MPEITLDQLRERYPDKVLLLFVVYVAGDAKAGGVKTLQSFTRGGIVTDTHIAEVRQFRLEAPVFTL